MICLPVKKPVILSQRNLLTVPISVPNAYQKSVIRHPTAPKFAHGLLSKTCKFRPIFDWREGPKILGPERDVGVRSPLGTISMKELRRAR